MQGRVVWYRPQQRLGVVAAGDGAELTFRLPDSDTSLYGGDLVEFETRTDQDSSEAVEVRLIKRWVDHLNDQHRPLVNEFHSIVQIAH